MVVCRLVLRLSIVGLILLAVQVSGQAAERRVALVIGNNAYANAPILTNPGKDARAVADMLKAAGFDSVELKLDLESLDLKRAVRSFLLTAKDSDVAVIFFAGHGIEVNGANYVIPTDARLKTDFDAEDEGVALERIIRAVEPARRLRLVILDACRDNPFINLMQRTVGLRALTAGLGKIEPEASDTLVAYAARAGSVAEDGTAEHSPFTTALLKHLPTPGLDIRVAFGRVRDDVMRATNGKQEPFVYGSLGGSTVSIVPEKAVEKPPLSIADQVAEMRRDYEFAERVATREAWNSFLEAHPKGFFAELARAQLSKFPGAVAKAPPPLDVTKSDTRKPAVEPPVAVAARNAPPAPKADTPGPASIVDADPCRRDRETLDKLRREPNAEEIGRFMRTLRCEKLRPQLTRLWESVGAPGAPTATAGAAKLLPAQPGPERPAAPPQAAAAQPEIAARSSLDPCDRERQALARLRAAPDLRAVDVLARDLTCKELKPQVMRLRESLQEE